MATRLELHTKLCELLNSKHAYFQPPANIKMTYPCIVYARSGMDQRNADDCLYNYITRYELTYIDPDPDSDMPELILRNFPMSKFDRSFTSDNLNHTTFTLYY